MSTNAETDAPMIDRLMQHSPPTEAIVSLGEAWFKCGCGERFDLEVVGTTAHTEAASRRWWAHILAVATSTPEPAAASHAPPEVDAAETARKEQS